MDKKIIGATIINSKGGWTSWNVDGEYCLEINLVTTNHGERYIEIVTQNKKGQRTVEEFHKLNHFTVTYEK